MQKKHQETIKKENKNKKTKKQEETIEPDETYEFEYNDTLEDE